LLYVVDTRVRTLALCKFCLQNYYFFLTYANFISILFQNDSKKPNIIASNERSNKKNERFLSLVSESSADGEADGSVALEGFFEAFVEAVVDGLGCQY